MKEGSHIKPGVGQGRAGLRGKLKTPVSPSISKPIAQVYKKQVEQSKVSISETSRMQDKIVPIPNYTVCNVRSRDDSGSRIVNRRTVRISIGNYLLIPIQLTDPLLNQ